MTARRLLCVVATAAAGVVAALAYTAPAANADGGGGYPPPQHVISVQGQDGCQTDSDKHLVTWKITNTSDKSVTVTSVSPEVDGLAKDDAIAAGATVTATEVVEGHVGDEVSLTISVTKSYDKSDTVTGKVKLTEECKPSPPPPTNTPSNKPSSAPPVQASASVPAPPSSTAVGGGLPVTGAPTIAVTGIALVLIASGTLLVLLGRRRRNAVH